MPSHSSLKRPDQRLLAKFKLGMIGKDSVRTYLEGGFSLAICCISCPRMTEWTPPELERRFGESLDTKIADIAERLKCSDEKQCGSRKVAVFPHAYDGEWAWIKRRDVSEGSPVASPPHERS